MVSSAILGIVLCLWHLVHTWYKEKQWRRNNPDEYEWTDKPVKKDPGLK